MRLSSRAARRAAPTTARIPRSSSLGKYLQRALRRPLQSHAQSRYPDQHQWVVTLNPVTAAVSPTPAPYAAPKLKLRRKSLRVAGDTAKAQIEFEATAGSDPLKQVEFHYTGKSGQRKVALPASGKKTITIGDLKLDRMITFTAQAIDTTNRKSPAAS